MARQFFKLASVCLSAVFLMGCEDQNTAATKASQGDVVVTELMPWLKGSDVHWFELHNTIETAIDLEGCTVSNNNGQQFDISGSVVIRPQAYAVISSDNLMGTDLPIVLKQPSFRYPSDTFQLLPTGGIELTCNGTTVDAMTYQIGHPTIAAIARSWQLEPASTNTIANDDENKWCYTLMAEDFMHGDRRFATPGLANPICESVMPYVSYDNQEPVLVESIDLEATLKVAEAELALKKSTSELPIWAIRDQRITPEIARKISRLYFDNIEMLYDTEPFTRLDWNHAVWHFAWAISNLYRSGDQEVKKELQLAYEDALKRPETLERFKYMAIDHIRNDRVVMGDIHTPAHNRMKQLIVAPGNPDYLQSYDEYLENRSSKLTLKAIHIMYSVKTYISELFR